ncbi:MAG: DinB family protein [Anaerolineales bacterium]|nr:DinB family protein [Anaerolineales bacterium]
MSKDNIKVMLLADQLKQAAEILQAVMADVPNEVVHAVPAGSANTIAANAAHAVTSIDGLINGLIRGAAPVLMSEPTGLSEPAPMGGDWGDWGRSVQVDVEALGAYAGKVMKSVAEYMGTLSDADLERSIAAPSGFETSVEGWFSLTILNTAWHTGEIASLKGTHGLKGYPF